MSNWKKLIEECPKDKKPIYMIACNVPIGSFNNYTTDQYAGWFQSGEFARWPHDFPPTHWTYQLENPCE